MLSGTVSSVLWILQKNTENLRVLIMMTPPETLKFTSAFASLVICYNKKEMKRKVKHTK